MKGLVPLYPPATTWPEAFQRRCDNGTAWTTGWTEHEKSLPLEEEQ